MWLIGWSDGMLCCLLMVDGSGGSGGDDDERLKALRSKHYIHVICA
jgi:hypothetical protein